jgi:3-hydroxybutyryl-CoA dehydrogenase
VRSRPSASRAPAPWAPASRSSAARAGFKTRVFDLKQDALDRARKQTEGFLRKSVERGKLAAEKLPEIMAAWSGTTKLEDFADCDLVIEAVFESLPVKHDLFGKLNTICKPEAIFASNTSTISITEIAGGCGRPDRFVGMHFCLPAQLMKLVEMSPGLTTSDDTFSEGLVRLRGAGPEAGEDAGHTGLRAELLPDPVQQRCDPAGGAGRGRTRRHRPRHQDGMGYAMGPMELLDLVGMDTQKLLCEAMYGVTNEPRAACPPLVKRMIAAGWLGKKTGRGLLKYADSKMYGA